MPPQKARSATRSRSCAKKASSTSPPRANTRWPHNQPKPPSRSAAQQMAGGCEPAGFFIAYRPGEHSNVRRPARPRKGWWMFPDYFPDHLPTYLRPPMVGIRYWREGANMIYGNPNLWRAVAYAGELHDPPSERAETVIMT